jgi:hypothetical protein
LSAPAVLLEAQHAVGRLARERGQRLAFDIEFRQQVDLIAAVAARNHLGHQRCALPISQEWIGRRRVSTTDGGDQQQQNRQAGEGGAWHAGSFLPRSCGVTDDLGYHTSRLRDHQPKPELDFSQPRGGWQEASVPHTFLIELANGANGYLSTQIQLTDVPRWQDLKYHELYNMGHLLTAACIHHRVTGKDNFLSVARKLGDYLCTIFLPRPKELAHFGFNPSNIMGAAELYRTTGDAKYLRLAKTFVDMRGSAPGGSDQNQAKVPLRQEQEAVGHAVTAAYLWCGAADVYAETGEQALLDSLSRLWEDVTQRKMYITGGTAALHTGEADRRLLRRWPRDSVHEAFGAPYQLPNRTAYNETCANIANAMWNWRMLALTGDAKYAEVMEQVLYNSMLSGMGSEGRDYFYTNPLRRVDGQPMLSNDSLARWTDTTPSSPLRCFCCPPNVARTLAELSGWAYGMSADAVWVHLYGSNVLDSRLPGGGEIRLVQQTQYPWDGQVTVAIEKAPERELALRLRIPGWAAGATIQVNGQAAEIEIAPRSYVELRRRWSAGDTIKIELPMEIVMVEAHPLVEENRNHTAVLRGPVVYCLESVDLPAGVLLDAVRLPGHPVWQVRHDADLLRGVAVLETEARRLPSSRLAPALLYRALPTGAIDRISVRLIPYYAWANRGPSEMTVWIPLANGD